MRRKLSAFYLIEHFVALRSGEARAIVKFSALRPLPAVRRAKLFASMYRVN